MILARYRGKCHKIRLDGVSGHNSSQYRAAGREGNLVDTLLSDKRDMAAAQRCCAQALGGVGRAPAPVTTDGHDAYRRAIREARGPASARRTSREKNTRIAQDHHGSKQRSYPLRGFGSFVAVARCCASCAEQRQYVRARDRSGEPLSLAARRQRFQSRWAAVLAEPTAA